MGWVDADAVGLWTEGKVSYGDNYGSSHMRVIYWTVLVSALSGSAAATTAQSVRDCLTADTGVGIATFWYIGHAGWAVKTSDHLLIFDYRESHEPPQEPSLANGFIDAAEIADQATIVFVTHQHGDHYDPKIFQWSDTVRDIRYVFGWNVATDRETVRMLGSRETREIGAVEISTINHEFDGVPEVAFLVTVDGLVIYHSGDHGTVTDDPNPTFVDNIDYLSSLRRQIDLAFVSTFGRIGGGLVNAGDRYTIEKLRPRALFPMHRGGNEELYERFAREISREDVKTAVYYANRRGDRFTYAGGRVSRK
ncbi:MAG: MBL fold metallo-hydrolase [Gemmatimonadota bacterium]|nr:MAG: MBL fold metallo-hydrolase [Gemmatimonadota bacterium]